MLHSLQKQQQQTLWPLGRGGPATRLLAQPLDVWLGQLLALREVRDPLVDLVHGGCGIG